MTRNLTLHYDQMMLLLDPTSLARGLVGKQGGGCELSGRAVRGSIQRSGARFQAIRQDPYSAARRDRRQQAAVSRVGADQGAAGWLPRASPARARCAAATAEQPRGAGSAVKGASTTPRCYRGSGLIATAASLIFRYVTELSLPSRPPSRRGQDGFFEGSEDLPRCYCSPAEPASACPVTDDRSSIPIRPLALMQCRAGRVRPPTGVSFLLCTPGDISILRRQSPRGSELRPVVADLHFSSQ